MKTLLSSIFDMWCIRFPVSDWNILIHTSSHFSFDSHFSSEINIYLFSMTHADDDSYYMCIYIIVPTRRCSTIKLSCFIGWNRGKESFFSSGNAAFFWTLKYNIACRTNSNKYTFTYVCRKLLVNMNEDYAVQINMYDEVWKEKNRMKKKWNVSQHFPSFTLFLLFITQNFFSHYTRTLWLPYIQIWLDRTTMTQQNIFLSLFHMPIDCSLVLCV